MDVYLFSFRSPDPEMVKDLGDNITTRCKGTISNIHRKGEGINFIEALFPGGRELKCCNIISAKSTVVVEGSILLQDAWLEAGVATLLIPQIQQQKGKWGSIVYKYCGLLQVHQISVVTSMWHSCTPKTEQVEHSAIDSNQKQQEQVTDNRKMQNRSNLLRLLRWNQAKPVI